jgi:hypothetical protein
MLGEAAQAVCGEDGEGLELGTFLSGDGGS